MARLKVAPITADRAQVPVRARPIERLPKARWRKSQAASTQKPVEPRVSPLSAPTFVYKLETLNERNAHRRAIRQAATWMKRPARQRRQFAEPCGLHALSGAMKRVATREVIPHGR
jgi:hypothetical protein